MGLISTKVVLVNNGCGRSLVLTGLCKYVWNARCFCAGSVVPEKLCWEGTSREFLLRKLELTLKSHKVDEAWETFNNLKRLHGFPENSLVNKFVAELSYSSESQWLKKTCVLVFKILKEKPNLLQLDVLAKLTLSLARAQMPIPASMILRLILEKKNLPAMNVLQLVFLHMVKTEIGTCIASNLLIQMCDCFLLLSAERSNYAKLIKPDTTIFNLVLDACVKFGSSLKGQHIMELMSQTGVIADAHTIVIIAQIHKMNGQRDELKKFKDYIDRVSFPFLQHYRQFYDCLLSLYFKFDDIDAASELVFDMNRYRDSLPDQKIMKGFQKPCLVPIGSPNLRNGLKIQIMPELLEKDSILKIEGHQELVLFRNGKLLLSNRALAKLINGYKKYGKISEFSKLLLSIQKENNSLEGFTLCSNVIGAFIQIGLLETAHDILDDMKSAGYPMDSTTYISLLRAYYKLKMFREAEALSTQMKAAGLAVNFSDEGAISSTNPSVGRSRLAQSLVREMREKEKAVPCMVYELNSSIFFFCKGKMIDDALKIYRRMQEMKIEPTVQTFAYLAYGYSSLEMYRDITILWGDIKRNMATGSLALNSDILEILLLNFLQGGYFERVLEVIDYMKEHNMYIDKWMYKSEFLKHHKNLYQSLKASSTQTEAQSKRFEYVKTFRKFIGIN